MDLESHDRLIAYVLGLSHALNIAFVTVLAESGEAAPALARLSSTTFDEQLAVARKVSSRARRSISRSNRSTISEPMRSKRSGTPWSGCVRSSSTAMPARSAHSWKADGTISARGTGREPTTAISAGDRRDPRHRRAVPRTLPLLPLLRMRRVWVTARRLFSLHRFGLERCRRQLPDALGHLFGALCVAVTFVELAERVE